MEAWFKDETPGGYNHPRKRIITKGDTAGTEAPYFISLDSNRIWLGRRVGGVSQTVNRDLTGVTANAWHHVAGTFRASDGQLTLYLDGAQVAQTFGSSQSQGNTSPVGIGRNYGPTGSFWQGKLDDIRLWNVVRSGAEIQANFQNQLPTIPAGLVANWRMDDATGSTAVDAAGATQNATLVGGAIFTTVDYPGSPPPPATATPTTTPTLTPTATRTPTLTATVGPSLTPTTPPTPIPGGVRSLALDGASGYAEAPHAAELASTGDWTVEAWFKDENPTGFSHAKSRIITKGDTAGNEVPFFVDVNTNQLWVGRKVLGGAQVISVSLAGVPANTWHHAAATYRASTFQLTLYLDGVQRAQATVGTNTGINTAPVSIGRNGGATPNFWLGKIDDVRVWNVTRSAAEINANFQVELPGIPPGLVGNWRFNEGVGAVTADFAGTPQNAALVGGATWSPDIHP